MWKNSKTTEPTATGQGGIKRRSKVPGVMITQYVEELPEGISTPDFTRKPIALTIQEGKLAVFKAIVIGNPTPTVSWKRAKGEINDPQKFQNTYDPASNEHHLEMPNVSGEEADTYKCCAVNEYGKAICTVILNVIEVGFKKKKVLQKKEEISVEDLTEFRNKLRRSDGKKIEKKEGEIDEAVWDLLMSADKKDYEHICSQYGIKDFRGMLKKLIEMKKEREQEQAAFVQHIGNLKHIEVKSENMATFELELELKDPNSRIFLYKDGVMVPFSSDLDNEVKHNLKQVGKKYVFTVKNLNPEDAGIYQVDVEGVNIFSTDFKIPPVDFLVKIQEVKAEERQDAIFECVTSLPMNHIIWSLKNTSLSNSDKYEITVSEDKLIHKLRIVDCVPVDAGIYTAVAGITSCSAWLVVEVDKDPAAKGKKKPRKTTTAGGSGDDLGKIAKEQQEKNKKEIADALKAAKKAQDERDAAAAKAKAEAEATLLASRAAAADRSTAAAKASEAEQQEKNKKAHALEAAKKAQGERDAAAAKAKAEAEATLLASRAAAAQAAKASEAEQQEKNKKEIADALEAAKKAQDERDAAAAKAKAEAEATLLASRAAAAERLTAQASESALAAAKAKGMSEKDAKADAAAMAATLKAQAEAEEKARKLAEAKAKQAGLNAEEIAKAGAVATATFVNNMAAAATQELGSEQSSMKVNGSMGANSTERHIGVNGEAGAVGRKEIGGFGKSTSSGGDASGVKAKGQARTVTDTVKGGSNRVNSSDGNLHRNLGSNLQGIPSDNLQGNPDDIHQNNSSKTDPGGSEQVSLDAAIQEALDELAEASKHTRPRPLSPKTVTDPEIYFSAGLEDCRAIVGEATELVCKLSNADCKGVWYRNGKEISNSTDSIAISQDGSTHKLKIHNVSEEFAGKYKFEADGRKTEAVIIVEDPPRLSTMDLEEFAKPTVVKINQRAQFKIPFTGREPMKIQWYRNDEELAQDVNCKTEFSEGQSQLLLNKLQRKDTGEIRVKIKNEFGTTEAITNLVVLDKPTPPLGPLEIVEASSNCVEIKWRPPKDDGGCPITNYILERNQVGRNTWKKIGQIPGEAHYKDTDVDHGRRYCYRIRAETSEGISELMETEDVQAGTKAFAGPPSVPKVVSAFKDCINLSWTPPSNTGGNNILGYILEKRKKGSNLWSLVNSQEDPIKAKKYSCKDVVEGMEYEFRVSAINFSGIGEPSASSESVFARNPKKPPGKVIDLKVTDSTYTTLCLTWTKPKEEKEKHDEAKGYFVEIRLAENTEWDRCNSNAIVMSSFTVKRMKSMAMYWVRVIAVNEGGEGEPQELNKYILAMPPPVRPKFTCAKIKNFMIIRSGNSARFNINFVASPWPEVMWFKDGIPVSKRVTISNSEGGSQILIPSSERSDSGIYTVVVKNIVGQETLSVEIRVTDEPKPPGPVELDMNVPGTVTVCWSASPDEKRDDRLHYMVTKRDSFKQTWSIVADRIFNNSFTACNIMPGREYHFRVYAKNDMGQSDPSESSKWLVTEKKEKFMVIIPKSKTFNLEGPPKFLVPLKMHAAPLGYECYMTCAVRGNPTPHVTWYHNNVNLNTDTNYLISNTCGVCSMLILRVDSKDNGEYKVIAENPLGKAECSTKLIVRE